MIIIWEFILFGIFVQMVRMKNITRLNKNTMDILYYYSEIKMLFIGMIQIQDIQFILVKININ